jgi:hypothetical protein
MSSEPMDGRRFKTWDRVRVKGGKYKGECGTVREIGHATLACVVVLDSQQNRVVYEFDELEHVEGKPCS